MPKFKQEQIRLDGLRNESFIDVYPEFKDMVQDYLGQKHVYGEVDCIELIRSFYEKELKIDFSLPTYPKSRQWMKYFTTDNVDKWASLCSIKVQLTAAKNYDVMVFKSEKSNLVIHFGMYLMPSKMFHIEEGDSRVYKLYQTIG